MKKNFNNSASIYINLGEDDKGKPRKASAKLFHNGKMAVKVISLKVEDNLVKNGQSWTTQTFVVDDQTKGP